LYPRLFVPATLGGAPNPQHVDRGAYLAAGRRAASAVARANGARSVRVSFPAADPVAPVVIRVAVVRGARLRVGEAHRDVAVEASADAQLSPEAGPAGPQRSGDEYAGPLEHRQGKPMRPDVAQAFDRMARAA